MFEPKNPDLWWRCYVGFQYVTAPYYVSRRSPGRPYLPTFSPCTTLPRQKHVFVGDGGHITLG